jgi:Secretion system C-terminal sorting domain/FIMAH domain
MKVAVNKGTYDPPPIKCYAVDNLIIWNYAKTDFSDRFFEAPTIELAIEDLQSAIIDLDLPKGPENSLIKSLENALKSLEKGNAGPAGNQLEAFINKVEAQKGKKLTEEEADYLIATVEIMIDFIESNLEKSASNNFTTTSDIRPTEYTLVQNYPNPFNPKTNITYQIPQTTFVTLKVYNSLGQEIAILVNEQQSTGTYDVEFKSSNLPSGLYIYKIQTNNYQSAKKMILLK